MVTSSDNLFALSSYIIVLRGSILCGSLQTKIRSCVWQKNSQILETVAINCEQGQGRTQQNWTNVYSQKLVTKFPKKLLKSPCCLLLVPVSILWETY